MIREERLRPKYLKEEPLRLTEDGKPFILIFRIPAYLSDRRTRPYDVNTGGEKTILGTLKFVGRNVHDFSIPNDPTVGFWKNFCLEDFAHYWELKNVYDAKYVYFQEINFRNIGLPEHDIWPQKTPLHDAIILDGKEKGYNFDRPYYPLSRISIGLSWLFGYLFYLSI
jgi:hypothetical protein